MLTESHSFTMCLDVLIFDLIPVEGNDTFQSQIEAHQGPRSATIRLDPPRVDFQAGVEPGSTLAQGDYVASVNSTHRSQ